MFKIFKGVLSRSHTVVRLLSTNWQAEVIRMVDKSNNGAQPSARSYPRQGKATLREHGFDGTSLQVADAVGMRKPSLLYHFRSKEALRESVIESLAHWQETLPRLLAESRYGPDRFANLFDALLSFEEEPRRARLVTRAALDHPELVRRLLREQLRPWTILLSDTINMGRVKSEKTSTPRPGSCT